MPAEPRALILGTQKGLIVLEPNGGEWQVSRASHLGVEVSYAVHDPRTGTLWACLSHGRWGPKLARSGDLGESWEDLAPPAFPEDAAELKPGVRAAVSYLWVLQPGDADNPDRIYIGTEPGGLFVSEDGGDSWSLVRSLWEHPSRREQWFGGGRDNPGIHTVLVDPRDSNRVLVGISCAGMFETIDAGESWRPRNSGIAVPIFPDPFPAGGQDAHLLSRCQAAPDVIWQQGHWGIYRTTSGGESWTEISQPGGPATFGFPIVADPVRPDTAWVVPAVNDAIRFAFDGALCVSRTDDGGQTWTAFREGLPQQNCYDLVYRHGLDLCGDSVAFGSTTGNLFLSRDRGESWRCLGNHFPPIVSVRFVGDLG